MGRPQRILVTGGEGFIGTHVMARLRQEGVTAVSYDLKSGLDILDRPQLDRLMAGADAVVHLAAEKSVPRSWEAPETFFRTNVTGTYTVLAAAHQAKVKTVVVASSSSALWGLSPYGVSKATTESLTTMAHKVWGLSTISLRFFNVFGPGQPADSPYAAVIPRFLAALTTPGAPVTIYGDGQQTRDFTYVDNVVHAIGLALGDAHTAGEVCDIGTGASCSVERLLRLLIAQVGCPTPVPQYEPDRPGDPPMSQAFLPAADRVLGYTPLVSLEEGLRRTVEAWHAHGS